RGAAPSHPEPYVLHPVQNAAAEFHGGWRLSCGLEPEPSCCGDGAYRRRFVRSHHQAVRGRGAACSSLVVQAVTVFFWHGRRLSGSCYEFRCRSCSLSLWLLVSSFKRPEWRASTSGAASTCSCKSLGIRLQTPCWISQRSSVNFPSRVSGKNRPWASRAVRV